MSDMESDKASDRGRRPLIQSPNVGVSFSPETELTVIKQILALFSPRLHPCLQYLIKYDWCWRCWLSCPLFLLLMPGYPACLLKPTCVSTEHFKEATECCNVVANLRVQKSFL